MSRKWDVRVDERPYTIERKGAKVLVNGEKFKIRKLSHKSGFFQSEYQVPVGSKTALLVIDMVGSAKLIIDGKDCATGEDLRTAETAGMGMDLCSAAFYQLLERCNRRTGGNRGPDGYVFYFLQQENKRSSKGAAGYCNFSGGIGNCVRYCLSYSRVCLLGLLGR